MNNPIFCHIRYCGSFVPLIPEHMMEPVPFIYEDFHGDWALLHHISLRDLSEEEYLDALELLL